ncbi:hypothetical protein P0082_02460 [Candidatus Haliotispira prima]|uniref:Uncharacterized protein n=1 Tax=Candidatus Haliotispira prima TaxID=3034016 RepID=A0ABY8MIU5_9SPIO|nr:hypothetical protein P0082_02460 [Candidatus Haliotispira prima]
MKLIIDVKDEKAPFVSELLRKNLDFVKIEEIQEEKSEILEGIKEAVEEMKLIKAGKLKGIPARELLNDL